jgi:antitoxin component YwqK of YwqJK toxin-antitoxin module
MRTIVMSLCSLLAYLCAAAQADTLYFNQNNQWVLPAAASYYRVILPGDTVRQISDYYLTGQPKEIGSYTSRDAVMRDGYSVSYYPDGKKSEVGIYRKGFRDSVWLYYARATGKLRERRTYLAPNPGFEVQIFDTLTGRLRCIGRFITEAQREGTWVDYFVDSDRIQFVRSYKQGFREGEQNEYYINGRFKRKERIENHKIKYGEMFDSLGKRIPYYPALVYPRSKISPQKYLRQKVPCLDAVLLYRDLTAKIRITADAHVDGVIWEGDLPEACREALSKQLYRMKKWKPGRRENKKTTMWVEIHFRKYANKE